MKYEIIKFLEENRGSNFTDIDLSDVFVALIPKATATKEKINKWNYIKLKENKFLHSEGNHQQNKKATY